MHKMFLFALFHLTCYHSKVSYLHSKGEEAGSQRWHGWLESSGRVWACIIQLQDQCPFLWARVWVRTFFPGSFLPTVASGMAGESEALLVFSLEAVMENRTQLYLFPRKSQLPGWESNTLWKKCTLYLFHESWFLCLLTCGTPRRLQSWKTLSYCVYERNPPSFIQLHWLFPIMNFYWAFFLKKLLQFYSQLYYWKKWFSVGTAKWMGVVILSSHVNHPLIFVWNERSDYLLWSDGYPRSFSFFFLTITKVYS